MWAFRHIDTEFWKFRLADQAFFDIPLPGFEVSDPPLCLFACQIHCLGNVADPLSAVVFLVVGVPWSLQVKTISLLPLLFDFLSCLNAAQFWHAPTSVEYLRYSPYAARGQLVLGLVHRRLTRGSQFTRREVRASIQGIFQENLYISPYLGLQNSCDRWTFVHLTNLRDFVERFSQPFNSRREHLGRAAKTNAQVVRHFEKPPRHYRRVMFFT